MLPPGARFATTKYHGLVVTVVRDDRAVPTAALAEDAKQRLKVYYSAVSKRGVHARKACLNVAVASRARRALLQEAHDAEEIAAAAAAAAGQQQQQTDTTAAEAVAEAYSSSHYANKTLLVGLKQQLRNLQQAAAPKALPLMEDPSAPVASYPDRIVECILLPDRRPRMVPVRGGDNDFTQLEGLATAEEPQLFGSAVRVYMQRRLLTTQYSEDASRYYCPKCWQCFLSKPGLKYHMDADACTKKTAKDAAAAAEQLASIDLRAKQLRLATAATTRNKAVAAPVLVAGAAAHDKRKKPPPLASDDALLLDREPAEGFRSSTGKFAGPRVKAEQPVPASTADAADVSVGLTTNPNSNTKDEVDVDDDLVSPDEVIAQLEAELYLSQGKMIGPMYPEVWKALGYEKPKKIKPAKQKRQSKGPPRKRRRKNGAAAEPEEEAALSAIDLLGPPLVFPSRIVLPEPAIIDTRTLVQEVDAGRYPSIKRFGDNNNEHDSKCAICKEIAPPTPLVVGQQNLIPCDFCKQVVHFSCVRTRFTLKDPEPDDDFMCHNCIGIIAARRSRAEKRRLEKLKPDVVTAAPTGSAIALLLHNEEAKLHGTDTNNMINNTIELTNGVVAGREFECLAAQGRRMEELSVLLRDAQTRLAMSLEVAAMNQARRSLLETIYE